MGQMGPFDTTLSSAKNHSTFYKNRQAPSCQNPNSKHASLSKLYSLCLHASKLHGCNPEIMCRGIHTAAYCNEGISYRYRARDDENDDEK